MSKPKIGNANPLIVDPKVLEMQSMLNPSQFSTQLGSQLKIPQFEVKKENYTPATNIPNVNKFGNLLARMGGMQPNDIIGNEQLQNTKMNQEELDKYMATRNASKQRGLSDLLMALGSAFKGEDIAGNVKSLRDERTLRETTAKNLERNKLMAEAYARGDFETANKLAIEGGDKTATQSIFNRINKERPLVSADGKLLLEYDEQGNLIGAEPNQKVIDALNSGQLGTADAKQVLADTKKYRTIGSKLGSIDGFLQNIEDGTLRFGFLEGVADDVAETTGVGADAESINSREFKNFRNGLVTDLLNLQTGTKTDFDWISLDKELRSVNTTEGVKAWLQNYKEKLLKEQQAIEDERSLYLDLQGKNNPFRNDKPDVFEDVKAD
jgi:hypothetical protein